tara:strand:+ start:5675 stop:6538 length:864 start_codon:yes stop_codon:yes gene_type:complete
MATNVHFTQGTTNEQHLYEDLVIESLKIYGQDVYYIPREIVNRDRILEDDTVSRFDNAYRIEMYIENTDGFDGEGDLFTKFGVEIRDAATFIVARRRWQNSVARFENDPVTRPFYRPREGDLIYLTLSKSMFEITRVETERPFYQLKDLPVFQLRCELFDYNDEDLDTGIEEIDNLESLHAYHTKLTVGSGLVFDVGEELHQGNMRGEVAIYDEPAGILYVAHSGSTTGEFAEWVTTSAVVGQTNNTSVTPTLIGEDLQDGAQNSDFDTIGDAFVDFSESNPFGDPQ